MSFRHLWPPQHNQALLLPTVPTGLTSHPEAQNTGGQAVDGRTVLQHPLLSQLPISSSPLPPPHPLVGVGHRSLR